MGSLTGERSTHALSITPQPKPDGAKSIQPDLTARAVRVCNRDPALIERYMRVHRILANKPSSEPENGK